MAALVAVGSVAVLVAVVTVTLYRRRHHRGGVSRIHVLGPLPTDDTEDYNDDESSVSSTAISTPPLPRVAFGRHPLTQESAL